MTTGPYRLETGGLVDRRRVLPFSFDGAGLTGFAGDTLASALLGSGISLVGRSFKYHRPRGFLTAGPDEPNGLVELRAGARREPNTKATTVELHAGLDAASQNRWPSLRFDIKAATQLMGPLAAAGFYYKTFMWPAAFWETIYEPAIRAAAGLGKASALPDPDTYEKAYAFCDVLVIGAGPAGLMAALSAGRAGARVIVVDEDFLPGGRLNSERMSVGDDTGSAWAANAVGELEAMAEVRLMRRTSLLGVYDGGTYAALERVSDHIASPPPGQPRQRLWRIVAKRAVLAAGALERPIVFGGNDRPGVMLASAARTYLNRHAVAPGRNVAIFTSGDDGWRTAVDLKAAGVRIAAVIDARKEIPAALRESLGDTPVEQDTHVVETAGRLALASIRVDGPEGRRWVDADALLVAGGWNPQVGIATHLGGAPVWSAEPAMFLPPAALPPGMSVAGAANGTLTLAGCLSEGAQAGRAAALDIGFDAPAAPLPRAEDEAAAVSPLWHVADSLGKAFVDLQNDVTAKDIDLGVREGFRSVEHLKRYTTLGMATDQGRTSNVNGLAMLAELTGRSVPETGVTRSRPPHVPVAIGALAGHHRGKAFKPTRLTPSHAWAAAQGAVFVETGQWLRAQWYPKPGETDWLESVSREARAVRESVGICDVSTLGKIALFGTDVGTFLDKVYVNTLSTLRPGRCRYGVMLREDGFVMDDGTVARLTDTEWVLTTTTVNAAKVMQHLEFARQVLWPTLDVRLASVTEQWAQLAVAGPRSRALLERIVGPIPDADVPYLACRQLTISSIPARLFRLSFSGELAYEIAVPAAYGNSLVRALMDAGRDLGVTPYGTEALGVLRIEKGHVAGNELNGQTTARDLGLGRMMSTKKDYVGRVMAGREGLQETDRPMLAGFVPVDRSERLRAGAHFIGLGSEPSPKVDEGYMTSVCFSPARDHWIGLGLIARGPSRIGEVVRAYDPVRHGDIPVEIVSPVFFDPEGTRLHG